MIEIFTIRRNCVSDEKHSTVDRMRSAIRIPFHSHPCCPAALLPGPYQVEGSLGPAFHTIVEAARTGSSYTHIKPLLWICSFSSLCCFSFFWVSVNGRNHGHKHSCKPCSFISAGWFSCPLCFKFFVGLVCMDPLQHFLVAIYGPESFVMWVLRILKNYGMWW